MNEKNKKKHVSINTSHYLEKSIGGENDLSNFAEFSENSKLVKDSIKRKRCHELRHRKKISDWDVVYYNPLLSGHLRTVTHKDLEIFRDEEGLKISPHRRRLLTDNYKEGMKEADFMQKAIEKIDEKRSTEGKQVEILKNKRLKNAIKLSRKARDNSVDSNSGIPRSEILRKSLESRISKTRTETEPAETNLYRYNDLYLSSLSRTQKLKREKSNSKGSSSKTRKLIVKEDEKLPEKIKISGTDKVRKIKDISLPKKEVNNNSFSREDIEGVINKKYEKLLYSSATQKDYSSLFKKNRKINSGKLNFKKLNKTIN